MVEDNTFGISQEHLRYIGHLRSLGIEPLDAINMAQQAGAGDPEGASDVYLERYVDAADAVHSFALWDKTTEGSDYWIGKVNYYNKKVNP